MLRIATTIGQATLRRLHVLGALWAFLVHTITVLLAPGDGARVVWRETLRQVRYSGVEAVPLVALVALLAGALINLQTLGFMSGASGDQLLGTVMEVVVLRELGPLVVALVVLGRSGTAIVVELGNMKVMGEMVLLESMGIDPVRYLAVPRLLGVPIAMVGLVVLFDLVAMLGGFGVASLAVDKPLLAYLTILGSEISLGSVLGGVLKAVLFGIIIAGTSAWSAFEVKGVITEVPQASRSVVARCLVACFVVDILVSITLFYRF